MTNPKRTENIYGQENILKCKYQDFLSGEIFWNSCGMNRWTVGEETMENMLKLGAVVCYE